MLLLLSLACSDAELPYATPERLVDPPGLTWEGEGTGATTVAITGDAAAWTLADADATWTLVSLASPDLSPFAGAEGTVTVDALYGDPDDIALSPGDTVAWRGVTVDADGATAYHASAADPSFGTPFGDDFARYGDALGTMEVDYWILTVREIVFATDDGDVAVGPSEPTEITVGGARYVATVFSAWESEVADPNVGQPRCGGIGDRFAYELVLVPSEDAVAPPEVAPGTGEITRSECG